MAGLIVLDASALIAQLDMQDAHHAAATERLRAVADKRLAVSTVTLAEVLVAPVRQGRRADVQGALRKLDVAELELPEHAAGWLATLRAETGLKMPDCCVLLTAEMTRGRILTFDERLQREAARRGLADESRAVGQSSGHEH